MKKKFVVLVLAVFAATGAFAEWSRVISAGLDVPYLSTTVDWDDDYGSNHEKGAGIGLDGQIRLVKDNGLAFLLDFDAGYVDFGDIEGADCGLIFGVGMNFSKSQKFKVILSGVVGTESISIVDSDSFVWNGHDIDDDSTLVNLVAGADLYLNMKLSERFGLFAQCTVAAGIGACEKELSFEKGDSTYSRTFGGTGEVFVCKPKFGVCWTF